MSNRLLSQNCLIENHPKIYVYWENVAKFRCHDPESKLTLSTY